MPYYHKRYHYNRSISPTISHNKNALKDSFKLKFTFPRKSLKKLTFCGKLQVSHYFSCEVCLLSSINLILKVNLLKSFCVENIV